MKIGNKTAPAGLPETGIKCIRNGIRIEKARTTTDSFICNLFYNEFSIVSEVEPIILSSNCLKIIRENKTIHG